MIYLYDSKYYDRNAREWGERRDFLQLLRDETTGRFIFHEDKIAKLVVVHATDILKRDHQRFDALVAQIRADAGKDNLPILFFSGGGKRYFNAQPEKNELYDETYIGGNADTLHFYSEGIDDCEGTFAEKIKALHKSIIQGNQPDWGILSRKDWERPAFGYAETLVNHYADDIIAGNADHKIFTDNLFNNIPDYLPGDHRNKANKVSEAIRQYIETRENGDTIIEACNEFLQLRANP